MGYGYRKGRTMIFACHGCNRQVFEAVLCADCVGKHIYKPVDKKRSYSIDLMLEAIHVLSRRVPGDPIPKNPGLKKFLAED